MKRIIFWSIALVIALFLSMTTHAQSSTTDQGQDSLSIDTTLWYNQTQQLSGVVVKGRLPKTRVKGDAMRTTVAGTILEKAGTLSDALSKIPSLEAEKDGGVKVLGRGAAEIYINGRKLQDVSELGRINSDQILHVDVVQNPGARYAASTKAVVRITLKKAQGEGFSFQEKAQGMYQYGWSANNLIDLHIGWDNTIELPKGWRINAGMRFQPKGDVGNFRMLKAQGRLDLGVQHDINLRRMGSLTLDLRCNDLFSSDETKAILYGPREMTILNPTRRTFILNLTWKFNEARSKYRGSGAGEKQKARM